jgi:PadR family transcriptional regulator, regulatory protein AphA
MDASPLTPRRPRENRTRYVVLGMLTVGPVTGYGLRQRIATSVGHFWQESYGQLYPTLRRLAGEGLVDARAARGGPGRAGATYHITAKGRTALAGWLALPPVLEPQRNELLLKVFFARAGAPRVTARNLEGVAAKVRGELEQLEGIKSQLDCNEAARHPDAPCWLLTLDFGLSILRASLDWLERARGVLRSQAPRTRAAVARERPSRPARPRAAHRSQGVR